MAITDAQSPATAESGAAVTSLAATFGSTPTVGNLMFAIVVNHNSSTVTAPAGWTNLDPQFGGPTRNTWMQTYYRFVQAGDGKTYTWTFGTAISPTIIIFEKAGVNASTPFNQHQGTNISTLGTVFSTASLTPSVLNCLPIAAFSEPNTNSYTVKTGWTNSVFQPGASAVEVQNGPVTSDTSTPIQGQVTWGSSTAGVAYLVLLAPATSLPSVIPTAMSFASSSSSTQNATVSGGSLPYVSPPSSSNSAVATATISSGVVTVTPV